MAKKITKLKVFILCVGYLPVILMELEEANPCDSVVKTYIYANSQIIAQHDGKYDASRYFYLHDRLGSVRQLIDTSSNVKNMYTYEPFGEVLEEQSVFFKIFPLIFRFNHLH